MVIVIVVKDDDPVQLRMDDIYDHSFVSTIQHHVHHISNRLEPPIMTHYSKPEKAASFG